MALKDVFEAAGLGTPLIYALTAYGLFDWLDRNASTQAVRAISSWLKGQPYHQPDIRLAIIAAFDRLYTTPLLRIRAFFRSSVLSAAAWLIYELYQFYLDPSGMRNFIGSHQFVSISVTFLSFIIISDYISLFIVRKFLRISGDHPFKILLLAPTAAALVIIGLIILFSVLWSLISQYYETNVMMEFITEPTNIVMVIPALLVHIWLLLFAVGALGVQILYTIFRAIEGARFLLKQGDRRPLRAIGMVAAVLVFAGAAIGKVVAVIA